MQQTRELLDEACVSQHESLLCQALLRKSKHRKSRREAYTAELSAAIRRDWREVVQVDLKALIQKELE